MKGENTQDFYFFQFQKWGSSSLIWKLFIPFQLLVYLSTVFQKEL